MEKVKRDCDNCGKPYDADTRNLKRGWGRCCSKSCAAKKREKAKPGYNPIVVERNNRIRSGRMTEEDFNSLSQSRQDYLNVKRFGRTAPMVFGSRKIQGITSEGYTVVGGVAYDEFGDPVYNVSEVGEYDPGDSEYYESKDY